MSLPDIMELPLARCGRMCGGRRIIATPPNAYRLHSHGEISYETQGGTMDGRRGKVARTYELYVHRSAVEGIGDEVADARRCASERR